MIKISLERLVELKKNFNGKKIAVIGDLMLDCYFWGSVNRISPEAPVPIVELESEFYRLGGAANVALNILTLGGIPLPIGVIGEDRHGKIFTNLLEENQISKEGIFVDTDRSTTAKVRIIANNQQLLRVDREQKKDISKDLELKILSYLKNNLNDIDAIILEDYNKGVLSQNVIKEVIKFANQNKIITSVDPKENNFFEYKHSFLFKPNKKETENAVGFKINNDEDLQKAGNILKNKLECKYLLITLGEQGSAIFYDDNKFIKVPTKARKVADVSGAGDTVIATATLALAAHADIFEASYLANLAGGLACEQVGVVPIKLDQLFQEASLRF